jgi:phospholipid/cholesterol/gamma-HCH transport system permease protein
MLERLYLFLDQLGEVGVLTADFFRYLVRRPFEGRLLLDQLDAVGVKSVNVVNLTAIFSGMVLALQMGQFLAKFGAKIYVSRIMGLSLLREMGPVLSALMVAARVGAGITAELGTMKVTEQIDAMRALGTDPIQKLVTPRLIAMMFVLPLLTVIADFIGLFGGALIAFGLLNMTWAEYWSTAWRALVYSDLLQGLIKPFLFAIIISLVGCLYGMQTTGGTQGVGLSTTKAVVIASIWIFVITSFIDPLFFT